MSITLMNAIEGQTSPPIAISASSFERLTLPHRDRTDRTQRSKEGTIMTHYRNFVVVLIEFDSMTPQWLLTVSRVLLRVGTQTTL